MDKEQQRAMKAQLVARMQEGYSWRKAVEQTGIQMSRSGAYRLRQKVQKQGEAAFQDGRHGHPIKLRGAARAFLEEQSQQTPQTPSSTFQEQLRERFSLEVSISQINRVRAALGFSRHLTNQKQEKKQK